MRSIVFACLAVLWVASGAFGVYQLATTNIEVVRFWDEADLILDVRDPTFAAEGGRVGPTSYATRKVGYALPIRYLVETFGFPGGVFWNIGWLILLLILPIPGARSWHAYAFKAGALLSLPYTMKYVIMINPTIQAMGLWAVLAVLLFGSSRSLNGHIGVVWLKSVLIGIVGSLIVLTDFKWLPFVATSVVLCLAINPPDELRFYDGWRACRRLLLRWIIPRSLMILMWIPIILGATALVFPPYGEMVYAMLFSLPGKVGVVRPGVSENFVIHLWYMGGLTIVVASIVAVIMIVRDDPTVPRRLGAYWIPASLISLMFTFIVWPRGARMFAPALVLIIIVGAIALSYLNLHDTRGRRSLVSWILLSMMTASMLINVMSVRPAFQTSTGLRELKTHIAAHTVGPLGGTPDVEPLYDPHLLGGYMLPLLVLRASPRDDMIWYSPAAGLRETSNWAFLNPVADAFTIEEQAAGGIVEAAWKQDQYFMRESLERHGLPQDTIPAPFFTTPYYICELTFEGHQLLTALKSDAISEWQVFYIGNFYNREYPGLDTTEIAP